MLRTYQPEMDEMRLLPPSVQIRHFGMLIKIFKSCRAELWQLAAVQGMHASHETRMPPAIREKHMSSEAPCWRRKHRPHSPRTPEQKGIPSQLPSWDMLSIQFMNSYGLQVPTRKKTNSADAEGSS